MKETCLAELEEIETSLICRNDMIGARAIRSAMTELSALRAAAAGVNVGVEAATPEAVNLPAGWRLVAVYPFKSRWEYCIERYDFLRCAGPAPTKEAALAQAVEDAKSSDARQPATKVGVNVGVDESAVERALRTTAPQGLGTPYPLHQCDTLSEAWLTLFDLYHKGYSFDLKAAIRAHLLAFARALQTPANVGVNVGVEEPPSEYRRRYIKHLGDTVG